MQLLVLTSLLWSLSFGLIKTRLVGLDASFVAAARLAVSALVFAPFLWRGRIRGRLAFELVGVGAIQFGLMYVCVIRAYSSLAAWQVALFTVLTPLHIVLLEALHSRRLRVRHVLAASLAIVGSAWVAWPEAGGIEAPLTGVLLVQLSNLCFALGQLAYRARVPRDVSHAACMGWAYVGAILVAGGVSVLTTDFTQLDVSNEQLLTLAYLGLVPSGLGFFLWNLGATRVEVATLAVMNNLKVPLAMAVSLTVFGESADLSRLLPGSLGLALALWLARTPRRVPD